MIYLYSGTPGSGKSLHTARVVLEDLKRNKPVICNFDINKGIVKHGYENFVYRETFDICPEWLIQFSKEYFNDRKVKEEAITLIIDEAQMLFNPRDWNAKDRLEWLKFFQVHRHFGYSIILVSQSDMMLDKQIRALIEYEQIHRKISNYGIRGYFLQCFFLAKTLFVAVKYWYPMKLRLSAEFFRLHKKYYNLYDTYNDFGRSSQGALK